MFGLMNAAFMFVIFCGICLLTLLCVQKIKKDGLISYFPSPIKRLLLNWYFSSYWFYLGLCLIYSASSSLSDLPSGWFQTLSHRFWSARREKKQRSIWVDSKNKRLSPQIFIRWFSEKDYSTIFRAGIVLFLFLRTRMNLKRWREYKEPSIC